MSRDGRVMFLMKSMSLRFVLEVMLLDKTSESGGCFSAIGMLLVWFCTGKFCLRMLVVGFGSRHSIL